MAEKSWEALAKGTLHCFRKVAEQLAHALAIVDAAEKSKAADDASQEDLNNETFNDSYAARRELDAALDAHASAARGEAHSPATYRNKCGKACIAGDRMWQEPDDTCIYMECHDKGESGEAPSVVKPAVTEAVWNVYEKAKVYRETRRHHGDGEVTATQALSDAVDAALKAEGTGPCPTGEKGEAVTADDMERQHLKDLADGKLSATAIALNVATIKTLREAEARGPKGEPGPAGATDDMPAAPACAECGKRATTGPGTSFLRSGLPHDAPSLCDACGKERALIASLKATVKVGDVVEWAHRQLVEVYAIHERAVSGRLTVLVEWAEITAVYKKQEP